MVVGGRDQRGVDRLLGLDHDGGGAASGSQWQQLRRCLHDTDLPLEVRVAGSLGVAPTADEVKLALQELN